MREYLAELHAHTVLSPCAELEMQPPLLVQRALERGLHLLAITDHNASANVPAVLQAAAGTGLVVVPGMELQTREDVHVLCLFSTLAQLDAWQAQVDASLPPLRNEVEHFGDQLVVDAAGDFVRREERLLLVATRFTLEQAVRAVAALSGLAIPAHVDRRAYGLLPTLGLLPERVDFPALEISRFIRPEAAVAKYPQLRGHTLLQGGDAHRLDEVLGLNSFTLAEPTLAEIALALRGEGGRSVRLQVE
jgi:PHP family Zn ribbon phosphoesterase